MKSIELNGFELSAAVTPAVTTPTGVFLYGGVGTLSFDSIDAQIDTSVNPTPYQIVIGNAEHAAQGPAVDLHQQHHQPGVRQHVDHDSDHAGDDASVEFMINGVIRNFDIVSATQGASRPASSSSSRSSARPAGRPFRRRPSTTSRCTGPPRTSPCRGRRCRSRRKPAGWATCKKATFGGNADAVGIDVNGKIGKLTFKRGLGNPSGRVHGDSRSNGLLLPATTYGTRGLDRLSRPPATLGRHDPGQEHRQAHGRAGQRAGRRRHRTRLSSSSAEQGYPTYATSPGYALTNAVVTTSGSIDRSTSSGTQLNTEIKTGFDYPSYVAGLEGTRAASRIGKLKANGDLVNSVDLGELPARRTTTTATRRASPGTGTITAQVTGKRYDTGGNDGLGNTGAGAVRPPGQALADR